MTNDITIELYELFPTPVLKVKCNIDYQNELDLIFQEPTSSLHYSQNNQLLTSGKYPILHNWIREQAEHFAKTYLCINTELQFIQSWLTQISQPEPQWVNPHVHRNSFISGVFYLEKEYAQSDIRMWKPKGTVNTIEMPIPIDLDKAEHNRFAQDSCLIPAEAGDLLLFPAYIPHNISLSRHDFRRSSIGFDLISDFSMKPSSYQYDPEKYGNGKGIASVFANVVVQNK
jgi:uncharacterized protein (TIGR02466 family)